MVKKKNTKKKEKERPSKISKTSTKPSQKKTSVKRGRPKKVTKEKPKATKKKEKPPKKEKPKKKTTNIEVCSEEWLMDYFKKEAPTGMTFALVKDTEFMQLIHKDSTKRGHARKTDGKHIKSKTKFEPIPVEKAIAHLKKFKLVVIRQVEGKRPNWFKIIAKKTAEKKGLL